MLYFCSTRACRALRALQPLAPTQRPRFGNLKQSFRIFSKNFFTQTHIFRQPVVHNMIGHVFQYKGYKFKLRKFAKIEAKLSFPSFRIIFRSYVIFSDKSSFSSKCMKKQPVGISNIMFLQPFIVCHAVSQWRRLAHINVTYHQLEEVIGKDHMVSDF